MLDSLDGLWHYAIVRCNNQYYDIRCLCTTSTHSGKRRVSRSIQEGDHAVWRFNVVSTDVLSNTTRFTRSNVGTTDIVQR
ncbi:Uncharacterised protein [Vibrio cholerae]|nr:Uncharacterised protein [Vibrio cholerae]CSC60485.1 Uncharacterised protein [Vibrio cholerae]CSD10094.1 Uncharacterised protein [Vibrio cholerae]